VTEFWRSHGALKLGHDSFSFMSSRGDSMDVKFNIYNYQHRVDAVIGSVEKSTQICPQNKSAIQRFYSDCLVEGLTLARISKLLHHLRRIAMILNKDFEEASKDDIVRVVKEIETNTSWSPATKHDYKVVLKKFYKWLRGTGEFPEEVKWIKATLKNGNHKLPEELLAEEDVRKLIEAAQHPRDKALILVLYESGCRIGELLTLRIKNILFDENGAVLLVNGKTGQRRVRIIASAPLLSAWLNNHPFREKPDAPLWTVIGTKNHNQPLTYPSVATQLRKIAKRAGVRKKVNPHAFRHARATFLASNLTEAQMKEYFGWVQSSDMASVYVHLSGRDVDNAILKLQGLGETGNEKADPLKVRNCARCDQKNSPTSKFCSRCGSPLDIRTAIELDEKRRTGDEVISMLVKDPEIQRIIVGKLLSNPEFKEKMRQLT
jgi:integrase/recombinase XerD